MGTSGRTQEENYEWLPYLADGVGKQCVGRDPMTIPLDILTESGHPKRSTAKLVSAFAEGVGGDCLGLEIVRTHSDIRRHVCLYCVEGEAEVRRCTTINCPFWPYRMGRSPHNDARGRKAGVNPFPMVSRAAQRLALKLPGASPNPPA